MSHSEVEFITDEVQTTNVREPSSKPTITNKKAMKCSLCGIEGHKANNKKFHPDGKPRAKTVVISRTHLGLRRRVKTVSSSFLKAESYSPDITVDKEMYYSLPFTHKTDLKASFSEVYNFLMDRQDKEKPFPFQGIPSVWTEYFLGSRRRCSNQTLRLNEFVKEQFPAVKLINDEVVVIQEFQIADKKMFCGWRELNPSVICLWGSLEKYYSYDLISQTRRRLNIHYQRRQIKHALI